MFCINSTNFFNEYISKLVYELLCAGLKVNLINSKLLTLLKFENSIIYIPRICFSSNHSLSFSNIYVNCEDNNSIVFKCADKIRKHRQDKINKAVFINKIKENENILQNVPTIIDNILYVDNDQDCEFFCKNINMLSQMTFKGFLNVLTPKIT